MGTLVDVVHTYRSQITSRYIGSRCVQMCLCAYGQCCCYIVKAMIKALLGCTLLSIVSVWGKVSREEYFYVHATWDNLLFGLTLVLPEIAEFTGVIAALSHSRLDLLNNSATHTHTLSALGSCLRVEWGRWRLINRLGRPTHDKCG